MARKKKFGLFSTLMVVAVLALAAFGAYALYEDNRQSVDSAADIVVDKAKKVGKVTKAAVKAGQEAME